MILGLSAWKFKSYSVSTDDFIAKSIGPPGSTVYLLGPEHIRDFTNVGHHEYNVRFNQLLLFFTIF